MKQFDLIVIGSGAGLMVVEAAVQQGLTCAIIEENKVGGTCLTRGCIPTKVMAYPADVVKQSVHADHVGIEMALKKVDWEKISKRTWQWIDKSKKMEKNLMENEHLSFFKGHAQFSSTNTIEIVDKNQSVIETIKGKKIVIAAGARSFVPPITGLKETGYLTYESFFGPLYPQKPYESLTIIGGGTIGAEFAHIFSSFGTKVTIVEALEHLMNTEEVLIRQKIKQRFENDDITVYTSHKVEKVEKHQNQKKLIIKNTNTNEQKTIISEEIFVATGLQSNSDGLDCEKANINCDEKGWIKTNQYLETSTKNIWALGDINGKYQFRHKANYEAELLIGNLFSKKKQKEAVDYSKTPWAIYTYPQIAHVGLTEEQADELNIDLYIGEKYFSDVVKGWAMGLDSENEDGYVKVIADENQKIIGVHIMGPYADILLQPFVYLMNSDYSCKGRKPQECKKKKRFNRPFVVNGTVMPIHHSMVIHPSLSEVTAWILGDMELKKRKVE